MKNKNEGRKVILTAVYDLDKCVTGKDKVMRCSSINSSKDSKKSNKK